MKYLTFLVFLCFVLPSATAQMVINAEESRLRTDTLGWAGSAALSFALNKELNTSYRLAAESHLQHKSARNLWLILGKYNFLEADSRRFVNRGFAHLRYNRKLSPLLRWEVFNQIQTNKLLKVDMRYLAGTGPRLKLVDTKAFRLYQGTLYMYEWEKVTEPVLIHRDHRLSTYLSAGSDLGKVLSANATVYYQPRFDLFADYRISGSIKLDFAITKVIHFINTFDYLHDTRPPLAVPNTVYSFSNGIEIEF